MSSNRTPPPPSLPLILTTAYRMHTKSIETETSGIDMHFHNGRYKSIVIYIYIYFFNSFIV